MTKCAHDGCTRTATHAPIINVPAQGWPLAMHQPLQALLGMPLCRDHLKALDVQELLGGRDGDEHSLRPLFCTGVRVVGSQCPPDFERAYITAVKLDSDEFRNFERMREKHRRPGQTVN